MPAIPICTPSESPISSPNINPIPTTNIRPNFRFIAGLPYDVPGDLDHSEGQLLLYTVESRFSPRTGQDTVGGP